jgi:hypothetical protein
MAKKGEKQMGKFKDELGQDEREVVLKIMLRIESACIAYRREKVKLSSVTFLIEKYLFQLRLLETAPDSNLISEMIQDYFATDQKKDKENRKAMSPLN